MNTLQDQECLARSIARMYLDNKISNHSDDLIINHTSRVVDRLNTPICRAVAWLHDVIEDSDCTFNDLNVLRFDPTIIFSVYVLTRDRNMTYNLYIKLCSCYPITWRVKVADILDHLDNSRISNIPDSLISRYTYSLKYLDENRPNGCFGDSLSS